MERDQFLTEAMGECWHEYAGTYSSGLICMKCDMEPVFFSRDRPIANFSTWQGFGKLWEWAQEQDWWNKLNLFCEYGVVFEVLQEERNFFPVNQLHPDRFANSVYEFLKGRE